MVRIDTKTGRVVERASASEVRSWLNTLNFDYRASAPSLAEDIYLDYCISRPSSDYAAYLGNLANFKKVIIGPLGWTLEPVCDHAGTQLGWRVPELEELELDVCESILLDRFWQFFPDAADDLLLQLFSFYAWKTSRSGAWAQMSEATWQHIVERTKATYSENS